MATLARRLRRPVPLGGTAAVVLLALTGGAVPARAGDPLFEALALIHMAGDAPVPDFRLPTADGKGPIGLAGLRGKVVLLNFWATWCPPCREEMPSMERLHRELQDQGLAVIAVDVQESPKQVARFMRDFRLTFPAPLDADATVAARYQVRGLPTTFLVDRAGRLVGQAVGPRDWASAESKALVRSLLATPAARR